jgi:ABC-type branched-subunit amino acid transport system substrate-binding protein
MFEAAEPIITRLGGKVLGKEFTKGDETDFAPLIARIAATKAKVLLFALKGDGLDFIRQADDRGLLKDTTVAFLGLSEVDLGVFKGKGQNMFAVLPSVATSDDPSFTAFVAKVRADAGAEATVSNYVMTHYNALIALKAAIEKAGHRDRLPFSSRPYQRTAESRRRARLSERGDQGSGARVGVLDERRQHGESVGQHDAGQLRQRSQGVRGACGPGDEVRVGSGGRAGHHRY